ncbi:MAG: hypothetical protein ACI4KD_06990 [Oscillospiraceae bacterium]
MTAEEKNILCNLIDESIEYMQEYENATKALIEEDFEELLPFLTERNKLMFEIRGVVAKEDAIISRSENSEVLFRIFRLKDLDETYTGDIAELAKKLKSVKILYDRIDRFEKEFESLMNDERDDLAEDFAQLTKTRQVIDYIEQTSGAPDFSGGSFNQNS